MMIYFTADTHFCHANIIQYCQRPFADVTKMDAVLIQYWNETVQPTDEIYILGDFCAESADKVHSLVTRLQGIKYLVRGNHDYFTKQYAPYENDFVWIKDYATINFQKRKFVLFHYPILEWDAYYREAIHCYGHVHNHAVAQDSVDTLRQQTAVKHAVRLHGRAVNVGVDVNGYRPVSIHEVITLAEKNRALYGER